jgi:dipeptidyl aminopeptidase/acylaminoacyl peptidase
MRKIFFAFLLLFGFGFASFAGGQTAPAKRPMTFEDMMNMKRLGETAVTPDGKWLAYSVTSVNLAENTKTAELWLQAIAGPTTASPAPMKLAVAQPGDSGPQFSADGKRLLFISSRTGAAQIWTADFDSATGSTTNLHKLTNLDLGIDNAKWAPDGRSVVFTAAVYPDCPAIVPNDNGASAECDYDRDAKAADSKVKAQIFTHLMYRHWNHYTGDKRSHLFLVLVESGDVRDLTPNDPRDVPPEFPTGPLGCGCAFSPDSRELAFTENLDPEPAISTNTDIFTLDLTSPAAKPVKVSTSPGGDMNPAYSPDGKYLAWRSQARAGYEADKFRLMVYEREKKTIKDLLPEFDNWVDEFAWAPGSNEVYFTSGEQGRAPIYAVSLSGKLSNLSGIARGEFSSLLPIASGGKYFLAASWMMADQPSEIALLEHPPSEEVQPKKTGEKKQIEISLWETDVRETATQLNSKLLSELDLFSPDDFWFTAADGTKLEGFIIRPPGFDASKKYPVKFLIHGGPQGNWGDAWSYRWNAELFAANGYVVIMINPRGSTGYGQAIVDGVNGDWGGKPFTDLMTGLDYAEQHYPFIDKTRECALGASYGGYMANWVLGHTDRFKCIVSHDGMINAESAFGSTEEDWFNIWEFKTPNSQGGHPWDYYGKPDSENPFRKWSPSLYAKNFKTPTLVVHGQLDYRLDVSEGFQLFDTLQLLKVPSKMLYFPDEGHWVLKPQNSQLWWKTVNDWVDQWTKAGKRE